VCRVWARKRLVFRHLGAYVLVPVIDEGEECAVAIQFVHAMLDKRVERDVTARNGIWRRASCDVEGERGGGEIPRVASQPCSAAM